MSEKSSENTGDSFENLESRLDYFEKLLKKVLDEYNPKLTPLYEQIVKLTKKALSNPTPNNYQAIQNFINQQSIKTVIFLTQALSVYFHLANLSEELNRIEKMRNFYSDNSPKKNSDPLGYSFLQLQKKIGLKNAYADLNKLTFHPVLTAHPTEARRSSTTHTIHAITNLILENPDPKGLNQLKFERELLALISELFRSSPIAPKKPTPLEESVNIYHIFKSTFFPGVTKVYERLQDYLDFTFKKDAGIQKPPFDAFITFGSWIGADRDGNPFVNSEVTKQVAKNNYEYILDYYAELLQKLSNELTLSLGEIKNANKLKLLLSQLQKELDIKITPTNEIFKDLLSLIKTKVLKSKDLNFPFKYQSPDDLLKDLLLIQDSLVESKDLRIAYNSIQKIIWTIQSFGFHLVELEIRQHSKVHAQAIQEINTYGLDETKLSEVTKEVLNTFKTMLFIQKNYSKKAVSRYIVSFTTSSRDIINVLSLAKFALQSEAKDLILDIVPLFETEEDLNNSTKILDNCLKNPLIAKRVNYAKRKIEIMLGYSDSSKDIGPVAANFKINDAQMRLSKWAKSNDVELILFHGRGGALGRGGGPAHRAIMSQPNGSINSYFKITEQGEAITARYSNLEIGIRHLETVCASALLNSCPKFAQNNDLMSKKYQPMANELSEISTKYYHEMIHDPHFVAWFSQVTPLEEIGLLPIGSRPAKRGLSLDSFDDLRAIPWVFSWSQARINLAAWLGFGTSCEEFVKKDPKNLQVLKTAYQQWPFWTTLVDNIEMSLAKTQKNISSIYFDLKNNPKLAQHIFDDLELSFKWVKKITGHQEILDNHKFLQKAIEIRSPYIDALSSIQVNALKKLRRQKTKNARYNDLLYLILCTVSGVAAGLQNTG